MISECMISECMILGTTDMFTVTSLPAFWRMGREEQLPFLFLHGCQAAHHITSCQCHNSVVMGISAHFKEKNLNSWVCSAS